MLCSSDTPDSSSGRHLQDSYIYKTQPVHPHTLVRAAAMENLGNILGNDGIAKVAGQKAGQVVETAVKNVMGGKKQEQKQGGGGGAGGGGGFGVGDALSLVGGKKSDNKGGFGVEDALSLVSGKKDESKGGGFDIGNALSFGDEKK